MSAGLAPGDLIAVGLLALFVVVWVVASVRTFARHELHRRRRRRLRLVRGGRSDSAVRVPSSRPASSAAQRRTTETGGHLIAFDRLPATSRAGADRTR